MHNDDYEHVYSIIINHSGLVKEIQLATINNKISKVIQKVKSLVIFQ